MAALNPDLLDHIATASGLPFGRAEVVTGGDINQVYALESGSSRYFLKLNDAHRFPAMFEKEAAGLALLHKHCNTLKIPDVIQSGNWQHKQWLLMEWLHRGPAGENRMEAFGRALAQLHRCTNETFGLEYDNYIGSLVQHNDQKNHWPAFYTACRILPLVRLLRDSQVFTAQQVTRAETFCARQAESFPEEPPELLHGDLWSGNYLVTSANRVALVDPAVYFGHREMDIGLTLLFGGFPDAFYRGYQAAYPLAAGWRDRVRLTQLYPLLVHAVLFGGQYSRQVLTLLDT